MTTTEAEIVNLPANGSTPLPVTTPVTPQAMLSMAVAAGNTALAEKIMDLQERWEARTARKAFDAAISEAKAEIPVIIKNREMNAGNGRTQYKYEDMAAIARAVDPILSKHGLGYRFRTHTENNVISVTCIIFHAEGHAEENTLCANADTSGSKNAIQALGSALTYLQRYSLKAALGLAASADDDGAASGNGGAISPKQLAELIHLCDEVGADKMRFCAYLKVPSLAEIPAKRFDEAVSALNAKVAKR
jgi:hypothetical protein